jgi:hypothetical protein
MKSESMVKVFVLAALLLSAPLQAEDLTARVQSLKKSELPDDFPFQILDQGFAIFEITIENRSSEIWTLPSDQITAVDPKGKTLDRATMSEITPKVLKLYRGNTRGIYGEGYSGGRLTTQQWEEVPTVSPNAGPGLVSFGRAQQLSALLEHYEIYEVEVAPYTTYRGFLYLKSKNTGRKLSGSVVELGDKMSVKVP